MDPRERLLTSDQLFRLSAIREIWADAVEYGSRTQAEFDEVEASVIAECLQENRRRAYRTLCRALKRYRERKAVPPTDPPKGTLL